MRVPTKVIKFNLLSNRFTTDFSRGFTIVSLLVINLGSSGNAYIFMMKTTDPMQFDHRALFWRLDRPSVENILVQEKMRSDAVEFVIVNWIVCFEPNSCVFREKKMEPSHVTHESLGQGFKELSNLFEQEYGNPLVDSFDIRNRLVSPDEYLDDMATLQIGRLAGVMLKEPFSEKVRPEQSYTGAQFGYKIDEKKLQTDAFRSSWQAKVYEKLFDADPVHTALGLTTERDTFRKLASKVGTVVCQKGSDKDKIGKWTDAALTLGWGAFAESAYALQLATWALCRVGTTRFRDGTAGLSRPVYRAYFTYGI